METNPVEDTQRITEEQKCDKLDEVFKTERDKWSILIKDLVAKVKDVTAITEAQATMLSYRHIFNDQIAKYRSTLAKRKAGNSKQWQIRFNYYKTPNPNLQIRYQDRELQEHIKADLAFRTRENDILMNQITWFEDAVQTMDKLGYSIKVAVDLETKLKYH